MGNLNPLLCWRVKNSQVEKRKQQKNALKEKVEREELHKKKSEYRGEQSRGRSNIVRHLIITLSNLGLSFLPHLANRSSSLVTSTGATIKTICGLLNARQLIMSARGEREREGRAQATLLHKARERLYRPPI